MANYLWPKQTAHDLKSCAYNICHRQLQNITSSTLFIWIIPNAREDMCMMSLHKWNATFTRVSKGSTGASDMNISQVCAHFRRWGSPTGGSGEIIRSVVVLIYNRNCGCRQSESLFPRVIFWPLVALSRVTGGKIGEEICNKVQ